MKNSAPESDKPAPFGLSRRNAMKILTAGTAGAALQLFDSPRARAQTNETPGYAKASAPVTITKVRAIGVNMGGNLVIVKVETSEPGLYGLGCATFTQRALAVVVAVNEYLDPFCRGKNVDNIEDMWQSAYVSAYWRNGPVLGNALSGLDQALWDIKGKRAGMPVYQLLGGKCRFAVDTYAHASGNSLDQIVNSVQRYMEQGFRKIRIVQGAYGGQTQGAMGVAAPDFKDAGFGKRSDAFSDSHQNLKRVPAMFKYVREKCGDDVELLHDMHELVDPIDAINMIKQLEPYRPFFIEDPFSPENMKWFKMLRQTTCVPIAIGELFNNNNEYRDYMVDQMFDYIRIHVSQIGGITPAMKVARLGEWFNVKTAWHGPGDNSPVGHAAHCHIDLAIWNFGIQESIFWNQRFYDVFPGCPTLKKGYMYVNEAPGLGVDLNEELAKNLTIRNGAGNWTVRQQDGTIKRP